MDKITIKTVKRASGYQARVEMPWGQRIRYTGHVTKADAIATANRDVAARMSVR